MTAWHIRGCVEQVVVVHGKGLHCLVVGGLKPLIGVERFHVEHHWPRAWTHPNRVQPGTSESLIVGSASFDRR